jgi:hypothetical protein
VKALLAALLLVPSLANALDIDVLHRANSRKGLTRQEAKAVVASSIEHIERETGVRLKVIHWTSRPALLVRVPNNPGPFGPHMRGVFASSGDTGTKRPLLVISPRYSWKGSWYSAGFSGICGESALAVAGRLERYETRKLLHAQTVVTHELGHMIGAGHDGELCSVMHPDAGGQLVGCNWELRFSDRSVMEIGECVGRMA